MKKKRKIWHPHPINTCPIRFRSFDFKSLNVTPINKLIHCKRKKKRLRLVKKHCLRMLWLIGRVDQAGRTLHFIWVSMYLHRQDRHFTWSSEPPEGVAISGQRPYHQFPFSLSPWVLVPPRENRALSLPLCKTSVLPGWANPAAVRQECFYGEKLARKGGRPYHHKRMTQLGASPF